MTFLQNKIVNKPFVSQTARCQHTQLSADLWYQALASLRLAQRRALVEDLAQLEKSAPRNDQTVNIIKEPE